MAPGFKTPPKLKRKYSPASKNTVLINCLHNLSQRYYHTLKLSKEEEKERFEIACKGSYSYIPYQLHDLDKHLNKVNKLLLRHSKTDEKFSFVDYGCGIGITLVLARSFDFETTGIEIDKQCLNASKYQLFNSNTLELNLEDESTYRDRKFDIVYFYCPFVGRDKETIFETRALSTVRIGGYAIVPGPGRALSSIDTANSKNLIPTSMDECSFYKMLRNFKLIEYPIIKRIK